MKTQLHVKKLQSTYFDNFMTRLGTWNSGNKIEEINIEKVMKVLWVMKTLRLGQDQFECNKNYLSARTKPNH